VSEQTGGALLQQVCVERRDGPGAADVEVRGVEARNVPRMRPATAATSGRSVSAATATGLAGFVSSTTSKPAATRSTVASVLPAIDADITVMIVTVKMTSENMPSSIDVRKRLASGYAMPRRGARPRPPRARRSMAKAHTRSMLDASDTAPAVSTTPCTTKTVVSPAAMTSGNSG
jgi:hypothetical protein